MARPCRCAASLRLAETPAIKELAVCDRKWQVVDLQKKLDPSASHRLAAHRHGRAMSMTILAFGAYGLYGCGLDIEVEKQKPVARPTISRVRP